MHSEESRADARADLDEVTEVERSHGRERVNGQAEVLEKFDHFRRVDAGGEERRRLRFGRDVAGMEEPESGNLRWDLLYSYYF